MRNAVALSAVSLLLSAFESAAVQLTIQHPPPKATADGNGNLNNVHNQRYGTKVSLNGQAVSVFIDTGSSDLWIAPPEGISSFTDSGLSTKVSYGDGSAFVQGDIGIAIFQLEGAQFTIPSQAFLNVKSTQGFESDFDDGLFGILGLGFNTPGSSQINDAVEQTPSPILPPTGGQSVLTNIFQQNPSGSDYIGISLSRTGDQEGTAEGSLTIAEYDADYQAVQSAPKLLQTPLNSGSWSVVLDGFSVGGKKIQWPTGVNGVPAGKNIVVLDTGTTNILMPGDQVAAIYSSIPGAVLSPNSAIPLGQFSSTNDVWVVPCTAQVEVVATFGGQDFPIHPLDVTDMQILTTPDGSRNFTVCTNAFTDTGNIGQGFQDALFGDSFLRNVYAAFDFGTGGSTQGPAFVQMSSQTDVTKSAADLMNVRKQTMANMPPEISPTDLVKIFNGTESAASVTVTAPGRSPSGGSGSSGSSSSGDSPGKDSKGNSGLRFQPAMSIVGTVCILAASFNIS
ncbi:aspartic peptidase domain-containing protein [Mycena capillaripes]|nr:aspartic peptidase domain-containing protein [Mycena capillaripes]